MLQYVSVLASTFPDQIVSEVANKRLSVSRIPTFFLQASGYKSSSREFFDHFGQLEILSQIWTQIYHSFLISKKRVSSLIPIREALYRGASLKEKPRFKRLVLIEAFRQSNA